MSDDLNPLTEVECEVEGCTYRNRIIHGTSWAYHNINEHGGFAEGVPVEGLVIPEVDPIEERFQRAHADAHERWAEHWGDDDA